MMCCCRCTILLVQFALILGTALADEEQPLEPKIVYVDGSQPWDSCRPGLKRSLSAVTGLLLSHSAYGAHSYNASRNCFLTIAVPLGYRIRLKALDFDVRGVWKRCEREDTLHIFDHERALEPSALAAEEPLPAGHTPGKLLGEFCGQLPPKATAQRQKDATGQQQRHSVLAESTHNALTLWWHTEPSANAQLARATTVGPSSGSIAATAGGQHQPEGFRLLWSSFRLVTDGGGCRKNGGGASEEFACQAQSPFSTAAAPLECIPHSLGCNSYADCTDASDTRPQLQLANGCKNIPSDLLFLGSGLRRLLLCAALVLLWLSVCLGCCCCWTHLRRRSRAKKRSATANSAQRSGGAIEHRCEAQLERAQMIKPSSPTPFYHQVSGSHLCSVPPPLPPPSFSPPQVPTQGPPPVPAGQRFHHNRQPSGKCSQQSSSSTSASSVPQKQQQSHPHPPPNNANGTATTTTTAARLQQNSEYFYVQQAGGDPNVDARNPKQQHQRQRMIF